jgi:hypothetical protein
MYADLNYTRATHEDRRIRLEGAASRHRLFHFLRQRPDAVAIASPARVVGPAKPAAPLSVVRAEPVAPGRTPGAAGRAA